MVHLPYRTFSSHLYRKWNIDFTTGVMLPQWINADGCKFVRFFIDWCLIPLTPLQAAANTVLFAQGAVIYAGGDSSAFNTEYSETVTEIVSFTVIPKYPCLTPL